MESRILIFLLKQLPVLAVLVALTACGGRPVQDNSADAEVPVVNPQVARRDVAEPKIDRENFELGASFGLMSVEDFGSNSTWGLRAAYHISESFFVLGTYGETDTDETSFEVLSGGAPLLSEDQRKLEYYDISLGYNLLPGEVFIGKNWAFNSALYLLVGAGNTSFADDDFFTLALGAGYRVLANDWLALNFEVRDHLFDTDLLGKDKTTHNIEFSFGLSFFF